MSATRYLVTPHFSGHRVIALIGDRRFALTGPTSEANAEEVAGLFRNGQHGQARIVGYELGVPHADYEF